VPSRARPRSRTARIIALAAGGLVATTALGKTRTHEDARVTIEVPDEWRVQSRDNSLTVTSPDETAAVTTLVIPGRPWREVLAGLERDLERQIQNLKMTGEAREATVNRLPRLERPARGTVGGRSVHLRLLVLKTPTGRLLVMVGLVAEDRRAAHEALLERILGSPAPAA